MIDKFTRGMKIARTIKGLTSKECASKAGIAQAMWTRMEQARQGYNPTLNTLTSIASALDLTIEELIALPEKAVALVTKPNPKPTGEK